MRRTACRSRTCAGVAEDIAQIPEQRHVGLPSKLLATVDGQRDHRSPPVEAPHRTTGAGWGFERRRVRPCAAARCRLGIARRQDRRSMRGDRCGWLGMAIGHASRMDSGTHQPGFCPMQTVTQATRSCRNCQKWRLGSQHLSGPGGFDIAGEPESYAESPGLTLTDVRQFCVVGA